MDNLKTKTNTSQRSASSTNTQQSKVNNKILQYNASKKNNNCFIATVVYGYDAKETNQLRYWRDTELSKNVFGKIFIYMYYKISPHLVSLIKNNPKLKRFVKQN